MEVDDSSEPLEEPWTNEDLIAKQYCIKRPYLIAMWVVVAIACFGMAGTSIYWCVGTGSRYFPAYQYDMMCPTNENCLAQVKGIEDNPRTNASKIVTVNIFCNLYNYDIVNVEEDRMYVVPYEMAITYSINQTIPVAYACDGFGNQYGLLTLESHYRRNDGDTITLAVLLCILWLAIGAVAICCTTCCTGIVTCTGYRCDPHGCCADCPGQKEYKVVDGRAMRINV